MRSLPSDASRAWLKGRCAWGAVLAGGLALLAPFAPLPDCVAAAPALEAIESDFRAAVGQAQAATVVCRPAGPPTERSGFSSGVLISPTGLVLSDGDAGLVWEPHDGKVLKTWRNDVDVWLADGRRLGARVLYRDTALDTALLAIESPPTEALPHLALGQSARLQVGHIVFALGTSFDEEEASRPALTVGLLSAVDREPGSGRIQALYVSAAVNPGGNGGPLIDLDGRLVGTVSTYLDPAPHEPFQFLARVSPIDRIREALAGVERFAALGDPAPAPVRADSTARALESSILNAAARIAPYVASLEVKRRRPLSRLMPLETKEVRIKRSDGPMSGVVLGPSGEVVTSLYNLTNVSERARPLWNPPPGDGLDAGIQDVEGATIHYPSGLSLPAHLVGVDRRLGIALLRPAIQPAEEHARSLPAREPPVASPKDLDRGRFVLVGGNPFGAERRSDLLLTFGILSKRHSDRAFTAWRGQWQTDAPALDTNAGGAAVDLSGSLLGILTLWHPARHGRNSGIGFVIPWAQIRAALPALRQGRGPQPGRLGVTFLRGVRPLIESVLVSSPASQAGVRPGDLLVTIDGQDVVTIPEAQEAMAQRFAGETVRLGIERRGRMETFDVVLAPASAGGASSGRR